DTGLLDRLLDIIHGDHSLGMLIHRRPNVVNKILKQCLQISPSQVANSPMTPRTRALLVNIKRGYTPSRTVQQFLERMHRTRVEVFDDRTLEQAFNAVRASYQTLKQTAPRRPLDGIPSNPFPSQGGPSTPFGMLSSGREDAEEQSRKGGFNRLAATDYNRDAWVTILSRRPEEVSKIEYAVKNAQGHMHISDAVRDVAHRRCISWLTRMVQNDMVLAESVEDIDTKHQIIIRFLSEIPAIDYSILRIDLACNTLHYLYMFRPPVRRNLCEKLLVRWRLRCLARAGGQYAYGKNESRGGGGRGVLVGGGRGGAGDAQVVKESANGALEVKAVS
ncbi:hypothetical protein BKA58DRAFT_395655, partial [Alternaria rosae]|uniref:uncharacterized protein n=1 Tax=Alternaria rosae TaxID=1187941 RepID=UPI001E8E8EF1